jgi:hypothetical protein
MPFKSKQSVGSRNISLSFIGAEFLNTDFHKYGKNLLPFTQQLSDFKNFQAVNQARIVKMRAAVTPKLMSSFRPNL